MRDVCGDVEMNVCGERCCGGFGEIDEAGDAVQAFAQCGEVPRIDDGGARGERARNAAAGAACVKQFVEQFGRARFEEDDMMEADGATGAGPAADSGVEGERAGEMGEVLIEPVQDGGGVDAESEGAFDRRAREGERVWGDEIGDGGKFEKIESGWSGDGGD